MSQVITNRIRISRRALLKGFTASGARIVVGLPPLVAMFNSPGHGLCRRVAATGAEKPIESRFVLWFNGNGIPERYWIPSEDGPRLPNHAVPVAARAVPRRHSRHHRPRQSRPPADLGNGHTNSMSGLMTGTQFTGRGAGGPSIDQVIAAKIGGDSRFRSLQIGVSQESFGESIQRNMSWAGYERALPPEMIPHRLFDRLFGQREEGWVNRKRSILDAVSEDADGAQEEASGRRSGPRWTSISPASAIWSAPSPGLPPEYRRVDPPDFDGDMKDWPRIAKLQSDLLAQALATHQTRVASYMLTKCQGLSRFPWLGYTVGAASRLHPRRRQSARAPTASKGSASCAISASGTCEEFAYLVAQAEIHPGRRRHPVRSLLPGLCARARRGQSAQEQRAGDDRRRRHRPPRQGNAHPDHRHRGRSLSDARRRRHAGRDRQVPDRHEEAQRAGSLSRLVSPN